MFKKFAEFSPVMWGILAALVVLGAVLYLMKKSNTKWTSRLIANAALTIALATVLSYIRLYRMPQGGSITPASMLPIFMFAYAYGAGPGCFVGLVFGFMQWLQDAFYMVTPVEGIMDYLLAYALLGLAGLARKLPEQYALQVGCVIGALGRAICAIVAGFVFFAEYAPEGQAPLVYSMVYNGLYLIPETIICVIIACFPQIRRAAKRLSLAK
ncbi:MAG: energy-coupled thiamine transporter ThiT [Clostridia bacterium]|nr:energy-coupled thiamine transporter ThiT [Clostridia bacterium]